MRSIFEEWEASELIEEGDFVLIRNHGAEKSETFGLEAAVVLEEDGKEPFSGGGEKEFGFGL